MTLLFNFHSREAVMPRFPPVSRTSPIVMLLLLLPGLRLVGLVMMVGLVVLAGLVGLVVLVGPELRRPSAGLEP